MNKLFALMAVLGLAACGDKKADAPAASAKVAAPAADDPVTQLTLEHAKKDLAEVTTKLGSHTENMFDCVGPGTYMKDLEKADAALATQLKKLCQHDVQLDLIKMSVDKAEPARAAKPDAISLRECTVEASLAIEDMQKNGVFDDAAKAMADRFYKACPLYAKVSADKAARK